MTTGQRMKARRKSIGLSAEKLADILGISPATIYRYENGDIEKLPGERLGPIASALHTTPAYLMGWENDEDGRDLEVARYKLSQFVNDNPDAYSGERLDLLFTASDSDPSTVCFNLGIDQYYLNNWIRDNDLPPKPIVDKILGVFRLKPEDLLSEKELSDYQAESAEWGVTEEAPVQLDRRLPNYSNQNIIRIAGRDGSYRERTVTDEQLALFAAMFDQLPDVPDDL